MITYDRCSAKAKRKSHTGRYTRKVTLRVNGIAPVEKTVTRQEKDGGAHDLSTSKVLSRVENIYMFLHTSAKANGFAECPTVYCMLACS